MSTPKPPPGWTVEPLGLANAVRFQKGHRGLVWSDGQWFHESRNFDGTWTTARHRGVPPADTMTEARKVGCKFLHDFEREAST